MKKYDASPKSLEQLLINDRLRFVIPTYQRPYVWDTEEILKFLENVYDAFLTRQAIYFIGNIYVSESIGIDETDRNNTHNVIDGQQRFITLWLIAFVFKQNNIVSPLSSFLTNAEDLRLGFTIRSEVVEYLNALLERGTYVVEDTSEFIEFIAKGLKTIEGFLNSKVDRNEQTGLADFFYKNVVFIYNIAPANTDLNSLFTALGNSGIQLEQTDILKAQLLKHSGDREYYSKIWEACENMEDYFERNILAVFPTIDKNCDLKSAVDVVEKVLMGQKQMITNATNVKYGKTIAEIAIGDVITNSSNAITNVRKGQCRSIIPFSVLLLHAYRIFRRGGKGDFNQSFDRKNLIELFEELIKEQDVVPAFLDLLWQVRFVFDKFVVKWRFDSEAIDEGADEEEMLRLTSVNTASARENIAFSNASMLQTVLYFTGSYNQQYWLTPYLFYLLQHSDGEIQMIDELEKIDNLMLPGGDKMKISWELMSEGERNKKVESMTEKMGQNLGTGFKHYWFYKLEYILWEGWDRADAKFKNYRITSKNSIEHVFPQHHEFEIELESNSNDWLNSFGNLGLLSVGQNSSYSNKSIVKKKDDFNKKEKYDSLKLAKIYSLESMFNWNTKEAEVKEMKLHIENHQKDMLALIASHYQGVAKNINNVNIANEVESSCVSSDINSNRQTSPDEVLAEFKNKLIDVSENLKLKIDFSEHDNLLGTKDKGFWFYRDEWKYCIYFYFGQKRKNLYVCVDHKVEQNPCDMDIQKKIEDSFKEFFIEQKSSFHNSKMWEENFEIWDRTSWDDVLHVIPFHVTEWSRKILNKLDEMN
ncbi:MAG: DUF262 domain-containing protein [Taibaiella sp.]|nr:DUF262 domain-containing protein [Taibaiella sp.]